jgi:DNA-binding GntR family transcriptional regulator
MPNNTSRSSLTEPIAHQAVERLRKDVINGVFPPLAKLKIHDLQAAYGFSSSPLREALNQLQKEGLVKADAGRGFRTADMSVEDFADITRLRLMLDVDGLARSIKDGDDEWESTIVSTFYRLEKVESRLGTGPVALNDEWAELHKVFHTALISSCGSPRTLQMCSTLFDQADRYRRASARARKSPREKSEEHRAIMEAALQRDSARACKLLHDHINQTLENVAEILGPTTNM